MKKITDERLQLVQLKNIRIAFIIQTIGVVLILGYDFIKDGMEGMSANPLWFVLMVTMVVFLCLSMRISVDYESSGKSRQKSFVISLVILFIVSIVLMILVSITDGSNVVTGLILASILFVCGLIPIIYIYFLRKE